MNWSRRLPEFGRRVLGWLAVAALIGGLATSWAAPEDPPTWEIAAGETLQSLSRALFPGKPAMQARFIARMRANHPEITVADDVPLPPGSILRVQDLRRLGTVSSTESAARTPELADRVRLEAPATAIAPPDQVADARRRNVRPGVDRIPNLRMSSTIDLNAVTITEEQRQLLRLRGRIFNGLANQDDVVGALALLEQAQTQLQAHLSAQASASANGVSAVGVDATAASKKFAVAPDLLITLGGLLAALAVAFGLYRRRPRREAPPPVLAGQTSPLSVAPPDSGLPLLVTERGEDKAAPIPGDMEDRTVLELADMMIAFGRVKGAAAVLQEYISKNPDEALRPWIKLLEVYRLAGMRNKFDDVASRLHQRFNVQKHEWEQTANMLCTANSIEAFPHIVESLVARWGSSNGIVYIKSLLRDNRCGERTGFNRSVVDELMLLQEILEERLHVDSTRVPDPVPVPVPDPEPTPEPTPEPVSPPAIPLPSNN